MRSRYNLNPFAHLRSTTVLVLASMARVIFNAEFMKQIVPSVPISHAKDFHVVRDEQSRPIIFSIGTDSSIFALLPNGTNGQTSLLPLGPIYGLSSTRVVSSMSALQGKDLSIYLTFAVDGEKTGDPSTIYVVRPSKPAEWLAAITDSKSAPSLLRDASTEKRLIKKTYLAVSSVIFCPKFVVSLLCRALLTRRMATLFSW